ncbi:Pyridoxal phosphate enzyme, YggS family [Acidipropionibacterium acidipropionici ATCC 4875]|uniref:Pyridoxal phosphate homeostasis protein n=1 Tax=Acidipropionibacterium acidipropionici (strain ATCC 4875 / DSM 20272 / JCM 6432 / NBRC 12425 / NCIMB 8070 / 4) TaxID=1171373 RepID=K7RSF0_ACIA4|nr:YggS family pyridoxal phosphate-dependent enzyme [Acidipropionibacterium acidipropionici]AFV89306.1 Pyridoxal phosphate enzyme, YggS family [Acidipropionibacterium acidipropionici ATCC 4875]ALN16147.1 pyridoxal phosphate biosynthesis protein [Acidipropionibacterium acidipropionici]APZ08103.1 YggS family pyridoxal phosphate enzyme [Acidipropionibacterium acidipropionici]
MTIADNISTIRARIAAAAQAAGRDPAGIRLLPVSKTRPASAVLEAASAGCTRFGENRVQEATGKWEELAEDHPEISWAIIGHLQTNKARQVARFASEFQALDSLRLARELDHRLQNEGRGIDVLVEINTSGEPQKSGVALDDAVALCRQLGAFDSLRVRGLMTVALNSADPSPVGACFQRVVDLQERLRDEAGGVSDWGELSMGMSGDFELAIAHGATTVRVGQAIFGPRSYPASA